MKHLLQKARSILIAKAKNYTAMRLLSVALTRDICLKADLLGYGLLMDSTHPLLIRSFKRLRRNFAQMLLESDPAQRDTILQRSGFWAIINPAHKTITLRKDEQPLKEALLQTLCDPSLTQVSRLPSFFAAMLYYRPAELPQDYILAVLKELQLPQALAVYHYCFNTYCNYTEFGEADRHAQFLQAAFTCVEPTLDAQTLPLFAQAYSGSFPLCSTLSLKETIAAERRILKRYTAMRAPGITEQPVFTASNTTTPNIGMIRHNFLGELGFFMPLLAHASHPLHLIAFSDVGLADVQARYPQHKYHIVSREDLATAAETIRALGCDILFNTTSLSGDFFNPVAALLSYRMAPIQVNSPADVNSSGIQAMDYVQAGEYFTTPFFSQEMTETVRSSPGLGYYMPPPPAACERADARASLALTDEVLFVATAHLMKLTPELLRNWLSILKDAPHTKLLLMPFNHAFVRQRFARGFEDMLERLCRECGVARARVVLSKARGQAEVSAELAAGDIYLDSFPYSGPTSTAEALCLGMPCVTMEGLTYRSRPVAALLAEIKVTGLTAQDLQEYHAIALQLATDAAYRAQRGGEIKEKIAHASFFDGHAYASALEELFRSLAPSPLT